MSYNPDWGTVGIDLRSVLGYSQKIATIRIKIQSVFSKTELPQLPIVAYRQSGCDDGLGEG